MLKNMFDDMYTYVYMNLISILFVSLKIYIYIYLFIYHLEKFQCVYIYICGGLKWFVLFGGHQPNPS